MNPSDTSTAASPDEAAAPAHGSAAAAAAPAGEASDHGESTGVRNYDLTRQEHFVRGRMPAFDIVHERFARNLRVGLFNLTRRSVEVAIGEVKLQKYSAFARELVAPTNFNIVAVRPLRGSGLVVCDPDLVFTVIDALFGGAGKFPARIEAREYSATEQRVIRRLVDVVTDAYRRAWLGIYPIELEYQRSEMQAQFVNVAGPSDMVVTTSFQLTSGETSAALHFCIPYATLEPIREVLYSSAQGDDAAEADRRWLQQLTHQIQAAEVTLVADLAHAEATVAQLLSFQAGDFIELDLETQIQARVEGVPVIECHYGTSNGRYALKVNRLCVSADKGWLGELHDH